MKIPKQRFVVIPTDELDGFTTLSNQAQGLSRLEELSEEDAEAYDETSQFCLFKLIAVAETKTVTTCKTDIQIVK